MPVDQSIYRLVTHDTHVTKYLVLALVVSLILAVGLMSYVVYIA